MVNFPTARSSDSLRAGGRACSVEKKKKKIRERERGKEEEDKRKEKHYIMPFADGDIGISGEIRVWGVSLSAYFFQCLYGRERGQVFSLFSPNACSTSVFPFERLAVIYRLFS